MTGRANGSTGRADAGTRGVRAVMTGVLCAGWPIGREARDGSRTERSRWMARACSCDTLDSFTPSSAPVCFMVTSPK